MRTVSRTVTHPNPRISQEDALAELYKHPQFKEGSVIKSIRRIKNRWVAKIDEPVEKVAAPPAFAEDGEDSPPFKPESDDDDDGPSDDSSDESEEKDDDDEGDDKSDKKVDIDEVFDLVKQIAEKVGVPVKGDEESPAGPEDDLPVPPPPGPPTAPGAPKGGPAPGGPGVPPVGARGKRGPRPGEAAPGSGVTPVGSPAFSNTENPWPQFIGKVATFDVHDDTNKSIKESVAELNALANPHGYAVTQITEGTNEQGERRVFAQISRRKRK